MLPRSSTPPTGPRGASPGGRGRGRGGIQKRRNGPPRTDRDGDLLMEPVRDVGTESVSRGREDGGRTRARASGYTGHAAGTSRAGFATQQVQQAIIRGLGQQANIKESRTGQNSVSDHGYNRVNSRRSDQKPSEAYLRVHGLNESKAASNDDGGLKDLLGFLERKANAPGYDARNGVRIKQSYKEGDSIIITASTDDAARIVKLNNVKFAGISLMIEAIQPPTHPAPGKEQEGMSQEARKTQDRIKGILSTRYDPNLKLLNLSQLSQDLELRQMGIFDEKNRISKLFPVLMIVCDRLFVSAQQKRDAVASVTLAHNDLDSVSGVTALAQTFPDLQNLDLSHNKIASLRALEGWRWKFRRLQNLRINQNPIDATTPGYPQELAKWFPTLQTLNDMQIRTPQEVAAMVEGANPCQAVEDSSPIPIRGPDFRDVDQIGEGFIRQFFTLYDTDRPKLLDLFYDPSSIHSLSINISAPRSPQQPQTQTHPFPRPTFKNSRNLLRVTDLSSQISRLFHGITAIRSLWSELLSTKHPDLASETHKYLVDCHPIPGLPDPKGGNPRGLDGLLIVTHGEFEELDGAKKVMRSFSRTFVLGPGPVGGPMIRVVSDLLVLRAWSPLVSVSAPPAPAPPSSINNVQISQTGGGGVVGGMGSEVEQRQQEILAQLVVQTQMTPEYASMCLVETGWDLEKALVAFHLNKAKLPPDAFAVPAIIS